MICVGLHKDVDPVLHFIWLGAAEGGAPFMQEPPLWLVKGNKL